MSIDFQVDGRSPSILLSTALSCTIMCTRSQATAKATGVDWELGYFQPLRLGLDLGGPRRTTPRWGEDPSIRGGRVTLSWVARAALECVLQRVWVWEGGSYFYV